MLLAVSLSDFYAKGDGRPKWRGRQAADKSDRQRTGHESNGGLAEIVGKRMAKRVNGRRLESECRSGRARMAGIIGRRKPEREGQPICGTDGNRMNRHAVLYYIPGSGQSQAQFPGKEKICVGLPLFYFSSCHTSLQHRQISKREKIRRLSPGTVKRLLLCGLERYKPSASRQNRRMILRQRACFFRQIAYNILG